MPVSISTAELGSGTGLTAETGFTSTFTAQSPVRKLSVVRNNKYVHTEEPQQREVKLTWTDMDPIAGKVAYYYVRIEQADGNLAWASPMWITYKP